MRSPTLKPLAMTLLATTLMVMTLAAMTLTARPASAERPASARDYGGKPMKSMTAKMPGFLALRHRIELLVLGDSRAECGVDPRKLLPSKGPERLPRAYSVASISLDIDSVGQFIEAYAPHLPRLKWVVLGLSPRVFNTHFRSWTTSRLVKSAGFKYDHDPAHQVLSGLPNRPLKSAELGSSWADAWGLTRTCPTRGLDVSDARHRRRHLKRLKPGAYDFDEDRLTRLRAWIRTLEARGIKVLLFLPPMHPITHDALVVDDDGTSDRLFDHLARRLVALERLHPNLFVHDLHRDGRHDFGDAMFKDFDHLSPAGREALSARLATLIQRAETSAPRAARGDAHDDALGFVDLDACPLSVQIKSAVEPTYRLVRQTAETPLYVDRKYPRPTLPSSPLCALLTANEHKGRTEPSLVRLVARQPVTVTVAHDLRLTQKPAWLLPFEDTGRFLEEGPWGVMRLYQRTFPAGEIQLGPNIPPDHPGRGASMYSVWLSAADDARKRAP